MLRKPEPRKHRNPFLGEGKKTIHTPRVKAFAARFPTTFEGIKAMINEVAGFSRRRLGQRLFTETYNERTAHEIIGSEEVYAVNERLGGCAEQCNALCAALRAKGVHAEYVRIISNERPAAHSLVFFQFEEKNFLVDPYDVPAHRITELTKTNIPAFKKFKEEGRLAVGLDLDHLNVDLEKGIQTQTQPAGIVEHSILLKLLAT